MSSQPFPHSDQPFPQSSDDARADDQAGPDRGGFDNSELLDAVLRETIGHISDEEAHKLISRWIAEQRVEKVLHFDVVRALVEHLLGQRFRSLVFPQELLSRVARWLWNDPAARARLELLWQKADSR